MRNKLSLIALAMVSTTMVLHAREVRPGSGKSAGGNTISQTLNSGARTGNNCLPPTSRAILDINNVRATILGANDMWWDGAGNAGYEVPKVDDPNAVKKHSLFAGSIWVGGRDNAGNLRVAAQTYRQATTLGFGWWSGPLDTISASTDASVCNQFNKHWKITSQQVNTHRANTIPLPLGGGLVPGYIPPPDFLSFPGNGDPSLNHANIMLDYEDVDGDGIYDPLRGDYPLINGDQSIVSIVNDRGQNRNFSIGMEIHLQAFAYISNDELNNMTFYLNKIYNRSSFVLSDTYMAQFVDPDLGNAVDDYVGCDVPRGLGICYNANNNDPGISGYGDNPPSVGVDFFEGPFSDPNNGLDDDRDGIVDEVVIGGCENEPKTERMIMSRFVYFNNDGSVIGNPVTVVDAYNYMTGKWRDNVDMVYGGNGYPGSTGSTAQLASQMFPGTSDQTIGWSVGGTVQSPIPGLPEWSELNPGGGSAPNAPGDRRFVQAGGPFTLAPGALNFVTIGVVWARASSGGATGSFNLLLQADSKAQALFDNCFKTLQGPDAPDVTIRELDQELIFELSYKPSSNNFQLKYEEVDPVLKAIIGNNDTTYKFQGFQVFQLADPTVSTSELNDVNKARLVFQTDVKDSVGRLINWVVDPNLELTVPMLMVDGEDNGIRTTFSLTRDAFAVGGDRLINHRPYYYRVLAYAYNQFEPFSIATLTGQSTPYFAGRTNAVISTGIPHKWAPTFGGLILNSAHGEQPEIKRIEGQGNGGRILEFTPETINEILASPDHRALFPTYTKNAGPVDIKVYDPTLIPKGTFDLLLFTGSPGSAALINDNSRWCIIWEGDSIFSDTIISINNEQIIGSRDEVTGVFKRLGMTATIINAKSPGNLDAPNNGFLSGEILFENPAQRWLAGLPDNDIPGSVTNWILAGQDPTDFQGIDSTGAYENVINGTWAPYRLVGFGADQPGNNTFTTLGSNLNAIPSVDVVFTADKSKWTRSTVIELSDVPAEAEGQTPRYFARRKTSIDKEGNPVSDPDDIGRGWFPGYAINLETGERLNIIFGEDSRFVNDNGRDLLWNPTDKIQGAVGEPLFAWGGKHYIYVMNTRYDEGLASRNALRTPSAINIRNVFSRAAWVTMPRVETGRKLLDNTVTVKLRVAKAYAKYPEVADPNVTYVNNRNPFYTINMDNIAAVKQDQETAVNALEIIRVVPNPYYAFSSYETSQIDNRVKVTNLPKSCTVKIFTLDGTLVRSLRKDDETTWIEWDLKNQARIPIASGMYVIHVNAPGIGDKIIKWFGVLRPLDLDTF